MSGILKQLKPMHRRIFLTIAVLLLLLPFLALAQERADLSVIHKIKEAELGGGRGGFGGGGGGGRANSQVMNIMYNLTDRYGPRSFQLRGSALPSGSLRRGDRTLPERPRAVEKDRRQIV